MAGEMPGEPRTLRLQHGNRIEALCVLGGHVRADVFGAAPAGAVAFGVKHTEGVSVDVLFRGRAEPEAVPGTGARWPLEEGTVLRFSMSRASSEVNDNKVTVSFYAEGGKPINQAGVFLTGVGISLDVDADRDGVVEKNSPNKASWAWGPEGHGAILLVSCDKEFPFIPPSDCDSEQVFNREDLLDMAQMVLRTEGPQRLPRGYEIVLSISVSDADKVGVFHVQNPFFGQRYVQVLGRRKLFHAVPYPGGAAELHFFVEGLRFPDETFSGLVSIHVSLLEPLTEGIPHSPIFTDTVVFRVAPWIMTPNTLAPVNLLVFSMKDNYLFTKEIQSLVAKAGCKLKVCFGYINRGDRWMQDEIELGYTQAPHKSFPVVLDSPRERGMEQLPVKELLGPDFGYVHKEPLFEAAASLDSFGNVEVSPPVSVAGKEYPLGRILIGSSFPASAGRRMTRLVRDFLYAQRVQAPVELYSDWLAVGNVNEFVNFVPSSDKKRFRMLLASPAACYRLFREKQKEGQGEATMFKGYSGTDTKRMTINKVLSNDVLAQQNQYVQRCIDWNRDILKKELGLLEEDIIDLPALFKLDKQGKAVPYFPNTVTMIVLARDLGIPKPFGPVAGGECCLERRIRALLEPLGLCCRFLEDVSSYHGSLGEVRCGTNVQRRPFAFQWWHFTP
ncbi:protein-arginine deiminase type-2-like [Zonotrichia leucophrys gambelii]|uniref:protein-arginine deiminase type-2-like n=1 Tax=Zonotrichia leucophrys gambelii TaxID=257770 RepID=UPI003140482B